MSPRFIPAGIRPGMCGGLARNVGLACVRAMPKQPRHSICSHSDGSHADACAVGGSIHRRGEPHTLSNPTGHTTRRPCDNARAPMPISRREGCGRRAPAAACASPAAREAPPRPEPDECNVLSTRPCPRQASRPVGVFPSMAGNAKPTEERAGHRRRGGFGVVSWRRKTSTSCGGRCPARPS